MSASEVIVASTAVDGEAVETIKNHHAQLTGQLAALTDSMLAAADRGTDFEPARRAVLEFLTDELLPYAAAKEERLYPAAARTERAGLLIESLIATHRAIGPLVDRIRGEASPGRAAAAGQALRVLIELHLANENDRVLPIVAANPDVSIAEITQGMHELLGYAADDGHGHECSCGESDTEWPELDVREIPHSIRHATVFGAFDAVPVGGTLVLVAPHDPIPLLHQLAERTPNRLEVGYVERGPEAWRLNLTKH